MLKKTITYVDYDGKERIEDFYFNLTKAEMTELEISQEGGLIKTIERIVAEHEDRGVVSMSNGAKIVEIFKDLILKSYGEKSLDGKRFIKSDKLKEEFSQTEAYSELFMELTTNEEKASEFVNGIIPKVPNTPDIDTTLKKASEELATNEESELKSE